MVHMDYKKADIRYELSTTDSLPLLPPHPPPSHTHALSPHPISYELAYIVILMNSSRQSIIAIFFGYIEY